MLNGAILHADDLELYPRYVAQAEGSLPEAEFAIWVRQHINIQGRKHVNKPPSRYAL